MSVVIAVAESVGDAAVRGSSECVREQGGCDDVRLVVGDDEV